MELTDKDLLQMYRWMVLERVFEEKTVALLKLGKLVGFHHPNIGQEAVDVGTCYGLRKDDTIMPTHRGKGKYLMKGVDIKIMMAGMFGRKNGCGKGRGPASPSGDNSPGLLAGTGLIGSGIPISTGAALAISIPGETQTNRYKYDDDPYELSGYLQDKIEFESVIINFGLRFDFFDSQGKVLVDVTDPNIYAPLRPGLDTLTIEEREPYFYKDATSKFQVSPRFGIAYPISAGGVVHFSYGHFLQVPPFQYLFQNGPYKVPNSGVNIGVFGNPDLEPQKTVMYEIGFRQELFDDYLIDVTGFYRDIRDWVQAGPVIETRNLVTYSIFANKDYANVKGITLTWTPPRSRTTPRLTSCRTAAGSTAGTGPRCQACPHRRR